MSKAKEAGAGHYPTTHPRSRAKSESWRLGCCPKTCSQDVFRANWRGPYQVILTTTTAVKCAGLRNWIYTSYTKKVACTLDHEEVLLRAPTTVKQVAAPEPEKKPSEPEIEQELVEDGSITPIRDEGEELQEGAEESISTETAGEPSSAGVLLRLCHPISRGRCKGTVYSLGITLNTHLESLSYSRLFPFSLWYAFVELHLLPGTANPIMHSLVVSKAWILLYIVFYGRCPVAPFLLDSVLQDMRVSETTSPVQPSAPETSPVQPSHVIPPGVCCSLGTAYKQPFPQDPRCALEFDSFVLQTPYWMVFQSCSCSVSA
ncbi:uncharacterized protein [Pleurodeles waltl]|uniref:uncharacterized protein n=1 Tax=Pleurodeles waltl TaxID=8319 RepID=UPI003709BD9F